MKIIPLLSLLLFMQIAYAQPEHAISFQQLDSLQKVEERPVLVFIHTDWCRYCQHMKHTTFQNEKVKACLDTAYYFVSLNAEMKDDISIKGQTFRYQPTGNETGQHELAQALGSVEGKLSFPTLCFLNESYEIIYQQLGYIRSEQLVSTLKLIKDQK